MEMVIHYARILSRSLIIPGIAGILCISGCMRSDIVNIDSSGKYIVCFGDSLTQGFGAGPKSSYPAYLSKLTSIPVVNAGIEGDTSEGALKRIRPDVLDREPLLVVVEFGANDFLTKIALEDTRRNIESIIQQCQKQGAIVALLDVSNMHLMSDYGPMFQSLSRQYGTIYIPNLLNGIFDKASMKSDYFHPNEHGYRLIAQRVYRAILPYLNQNALLTKFKKE
ncbi:MAG TPA: GDSL-type esterase/lipase family protein [Candidatus Omnitrophota bacterium]|nr:GDSL-type esterase/lipase family protein [Candidatus Omnitrophota bacterium]